MFAGFRFRFSVNAFHVLSSTIAVFVIAIMLGAAGPAAAAPEALVQQIAIGGDHGCALTLSGGVKCWGSNANGQLGDGSTTNGLAPVDVPDLSGGVTTIAAIRKWMHPGAELAGYEPLFEGLRLAGVPD